MKILDMIVAQQTSECYLQFDFAAFCLAGEKSLTKALEYGFIEILAGLLVWWPF